MRLGERAQRVEVVAVDLERDLGAHAGEHVVEPVADRLADVDAAGQHTEARADIGQIACLPRSDACESDVDLGGMHALGMLIELGAAGAAADRAAPRAPA